MANYYLNGSLIPEGSPVTLNGMEYPYSWLETTTQQVRASHGIEKNGDINFDEKYYLTTDTPKSLDDVEAVDEDGNPVFITTYDPNADGGKGAMVPTSKREIQLGLKSICLAEIKTKTNQLLESTDSYIIRNHVEETSIPESVSTYREAVITESNRIQTAIPAVTTVEELIQVMHSITWPKAD